MEVFHEEEIEEHAVFFLNLVFGVKKLFKFFFILPLCELPLPLVGPLLPLQWKMVH